MKLAHIAPYAVRRHRSKEFDIRIPEFFANVSFHRAGLVRKSCSEIGSVCEARHLGNRLRLAIHRTVEKRSVAVAAKRELAALPVVGACEHALAVAADRKRLTPWQSLANDGIRLPRLKQPDNTIKQTDGELLVARNAHDVKNGRTQPCAVLGAMHTVGSKPESCIVGGNSSIVHPPCFAQVVSCWTYDRIVLASPADLRQEFRDNPPFRRLDAMAPKRLPAIFVGAVDCAVRAFERRMLASYRIRRTADHRERHENC